MERLTQFISSEAGTIALNTLLSQLYEGIFPKLDPTMGDTACHIRAFALQQIANKLQNEIAITAEEKYFIMALSILSDEKVSLLDYNEMGIITCDNSTLIAAPDYIDFSDVTSNKKLEKATKVFILGLKQFVSNYSLALLKDTFSTYSAGNDGVAISTSMIGDYQKYVQRANPADRLAVLPLLAAGMATISIALKQNALILLTISRYVRTFIADCKEQTSLTLQDSNILAFKAVDNHLVLLTDTKEYATTAAITYSCISITNSPALAFSAYMASLLAFDPLQLLYVLHILHPQYPKLEKDVTPPLAEYETNSKAPLFTMYHDLTKFAEAHGLSYAPSDLHTDDTLKTIAIQVDHVTASSIAKEQIALAEVKSKCHDMALLRSVAGAALIRKPAVITLRMVPALEEPGLDKKLLEKCTAMSGLALY